MRASILRRPLYVETLSDEDLKLHVQSAVVREIAKRKRTVPTKGYSRLASLRDRLEKATDRSTVLEISVGLLVEKAQWPSLRDRLLKAGQNSGKTLRERTRCG